MSTLKYTKHERIWLKSHAEFNERWLQDRIVEEPSILEIGELVVIERERRQEKAGRLDLLMGDPDQNYRYEVELMLGSTDESHIIRCIEYWDIERRRYPAYEHCAVLIAEDITTRFLNLLALFAGTIPLIGIQLNALQVGDKILLDFVRVLDQRSLRREDQVEAKLSTVDRSYWSDKSTAKMVEFADGLLTIINEKASPQQQLNYNRYYIGLTDGVRSRNFIYFRLRKKYLHLIAEVDEASDWVEQFEEAGLSATVNKDRARVTLSPQQFKRNKDLLTALLHSAVEKHQR